MDGNDIYNKLVDGEPYGHVRGHVEELEAGAAMLADNERSFLNGVLASMALDMPLGVATERQLRQLIVTLRQRIHAASTPR